VGEIRKGNKGWEVENSQGHGTLFSKAKEKLKVESAGEGRSSHPEFISSSPY